MEKELGKLTKLDTLRDLWPNEEKDFTPWLVDNIDILGSAIKIKINPESLEREKRIGSKELDIFAIEASEDERVIIIENQLEEANHTHLGQIITYASGTDADIMVWVVKKASEEHRNAIEWLNNNTGEDKLFFLLQIEVWQIDDSKPAPYFRVLESPNNYYKETQTKTRASKEHTRSRLKLNEIGINTGETITFTPANIDVIVVDNNQVEYKGEFYSLTGFTKEFMPEEQRNESGAYQGGKFFTYKGEILTDIRDRIEKELEMAEE